MAKRCWIYGWAAELMAFFIFRRGIWDSLLQHTKVTGEASESRTIGILGQKFTFTANRADAEHRRRKK